MEKPDGGIEHFVRAVDEPRIILGENGWIGETEGARAMVVRREEDGTYSLGFLFNFGTLIACMENGRERNVVPTSPQESAEAFGNLWTLDEKTRNLRIPPDVWATSGRLRLWFKNPNVAACLFAEFAALGLALLFFFRRWAVAVGLMLLLGGVWGIFACGSRGALVALAAAAFAMLLLRVRKLLTLRRLLLTAVVLTSIAGFAIWRGGADARFSRSFFSQDKQTSRTEIWKSVPQMVHDAPGGWGAGSSGRAYVEWYQAESTCLLRDLISAHFTYLVEWGWLARGIFFAGWLLVLSAGVLMACRGGSLLPLTAWLTFGVAGVFNPVSRHWETWILPVSQAVALFVWLFQNRRTLRNCALFAMGMSLLLCGGLYLAGYWQGSSSRPSVCFSGGAVLVNGKNPTTWLVDDDLTLHGGYWWTFGREVREYYRQNPRAEALGIVRSVEALPSDAKKVVVVGKATPDFIDALTTGRMTIAPSAEIVFLSPSLSETSIRRTDFAARRVSFIRGEFASRLSGDHDRDADQRVEVRGAELYIPNWLSMILARGR